MLLKFRLDLNSNFGSSYGTQIYEEIKKIISIEPNKLSINFKIY
jgi:hypothetical protein